MTAGGVSAPGGNPVTADPGLSPRFPPVRMVGPVFVTVDPASTRKLAAEFKGTAWWHATLEVVKVQTSSLASPLPERSLAPVVMVAVYNVFSESGALGV